MLAIASEAGAQPTVCEPCTRGNALINKLGLQELRTRASELAALPATEPLTPNQYAKIVELRQQSPALQQLATLDDDELVLVAAALCGAPGGSCTAATTSVLRCFADRCKVAFPEPPPERADVLVRPESCDPYVKTVRSPRLGLGFDYGTGWQRSGFPSEGRAWSLGLEGRYRLATRVGAVARVDHVAGRDEGIDGNADGKDDLSSGSITRVTALAGPSFVLHHARFEDTVRLLRLDLLGGYVSTRSQPGEDGPAAGVDLSYELSIVRAGIRIVQGFAGAEDATAALVHLGFLAGSGISYSYGAGCGASSSKPTTRLALGFELPLIGYGISSDLGLLVPGFGLTSIWYVSPSVDAVVYADAVVYPRSDKDRVIHQSLLAGTRIDFGSGTGKSSRTGFFTTVMAGYQHAAGPSPTDVGSGPVVDIALAWGGQGADGAGYFKLHGRFGVTPDNFESRAIFLSSGIEIRLDSDRWRDRL